MPIRDHNPSGNFPLITATIILINIFAFIVEITLPPDQFENLIYNYALIPSKIDFLNPATLTPFVTSLFLHASLIHIFSNMLFLWVFGDNIENKLGKLKFILFYLAGGILAGLAQYLFISSSNIPMLGASGAIAAVLGAYLIIYPNARIDVLIPIFLLPTIISVPAYIMLLYWFFTQLIAGAATIVEQTAAFGGIAFIAHIGGFIAGVILIRLLNPKIAD